MRLSFAEGERASPSTASDEMKTMMRIARGPMRWWLPFERGRREDDEFVIIIISWVKGLLLSFSPGPSLGGLNHEWGVWGASCRIWRELHPSLIDEDRQDDDHRKKKKRDGTHPQCPMLPFDIPFYDALGYLNMWSSFFSSSPFSYFLHLNSHHHDDDRPW